MVLRHRNIFVIVLWSIGTLKKNYFPYYSKHNSITRFRNIYFLLHIYYLIVFTKKYIHVHINIPLKIPEWN